MQLNDSELKQFIDGSVEICCTHHVLWHSINSSWQSLPNTDLDYEMRDTHTYSALLLTKGFVLL